MSLAFAIDQKDNVLGSRIETNFRRSRREGNRSAQAWLAVRGAATRHQLRQGSQVVLRIMMEPMPNNHRQPVDRTKLLMKLRELEEEWRAFEGRLREEEGEIWQPDWSHGDALAERLSRVGYPQETIDVLKKHLDIINRFLCGEPLSPDILKDLDQMDAAERAAGESAVKQLAAIVIATPNRVPQAEQPQSPRYGVEVSRISNPPNFPGFIRFGG